jgi:hypothetical protein
MAHGSSGRVPNCVFSAESLSRFTKKIQRTPQVFAGAAVTGRVFPRHHPDKRAEIIIVERRIQRWRKSPLQNLKRLWHSVRQMGAQHVDHMLDTGFQLQFGESGQYRAFESFALKTLARAGQTPGQFTNGVRVEQIIFQRKACFSAYAQDWMPFLWTCR